MNKKHKNTRKGFTLLEILLVIAAIGILAAIVLVAINPNKQIEAARSAKRRADINTITKAIQQYSIDNNGQYPTGIETGAKAICKGGTPVGCVDLSVLSPNYIASIPDPDSNYYYVRRSNNSIEVSHPRDTIWNIGGNPSLDLNFARNKSLIDSVSGNNLVTFTRAAIPGVVDTDGSEAGDLPTSGRGATYFDSDRVMRYSSPNTARFDHNPTTGESLGLLVEEQRTNLLTYSAEFNNALWSNDNFTVTADTIVSPDGTLTGDKLAANAGSSLKVARKFSAISITAGTVYTASVYVKNSGVQYVSFTFDDNVTTNGVTTTFDLINGTISRAAVSYGTGASAASTINAVGNGWYRITITGTAGTTSVLGRWAISVQPSGTTQFNSYTGNGVDGIYLWGAQLEAGAFPTSYIPTSTNAATRNADVVSIAGTNFSSWYNQTEGQDEGTVFADAKEYPFPSSSSRTFYAIDNSAAPNSDFIRQWIWNGNTSQLLNSVYTSSGGPVAAEFSQSIVNENKITALAFKLNDFARSYKGAAALSDVSGNLPIAVDRLAIGNSVSAQYLSGHIRRFTYFPQKLSNANLQKITQ